jgi:hypothetical protein
MPPTDRNANKDYAIFLIRDNANNKIVDLTTDSNKRNYKFSILKNLKDGTEKKNPVNQLFKNSDTDTIIFDILDTFNGTYAEALDYMTKLAEKHHFKTTRSIDCDVLAIQEQIKKEKQEAQTPTPTEPLTQKQDKKTKPQKILDTPPILEVVEITLPPKKKVVKKIPIEEPTEEQAKQISEAIKTPIKQVKATKAPPPPIVEEETEEDEEEPAPSPPPIKKETKTRLAQKNRLISECETLHAIYNDLNDSVFKAKQKILMKQEELKTEYDYNLKLV